MIERRLKRFRPEVQGAVCSLAARHERLADLVLSFPALCVALAVPRTGFCSEPVIGQVKAGAPLTALARYAGLPLWTRKLPEEAFAGPVPLLPERDWFGRQITNHLPPRGRLAAIWLETVSQAAHWGHDAFALWVAREFRHDRKRITGIQRGRLRQMALWAWYSARPETEAYAWMEKPWNPGMRMKTAGGAVNRWWDAVDLYINMGGTILADAWLAPAVVDGYEFVALRSAGEVAEEARAMRNCLCTYGGHLTHNISRLWSIRRDGARIATLRLCRLRHRPLPEIVELELSGNRKADAELWYVAQKWLMCHDLRKIGDDRLTWDTAPLDVALWRKTWKPYWLAKGTIPSWLPLNPSRFVLDAM